MIEIKALQDESIYMNTLACGLRVAIHPKRDFHNTIVTLQVDFGGSYLHYMQGEVEHRLPAGVAHFLEHLMFNNMDFNLSEFFASKGAEINAFTSNSNTSYRFESINHIKSLLDMFLLNFTDFQIGDELLEKERTIIAHELTMSDDSVHVDMHQKLLKMMYQDPSIFSDVGGEVKDIMQTGLHHLKQAFEGFYHPHNSSLIITGNVDSEEIFQLLESHPYNTKEWPVFQPVEPLIEDGKRRIHHVHKTVSQIPEPMVTFAVKIPQRFFHQRDREYLHIALGSITANIFGLGSKTYDYLEKLKLMNVSFFAKTSVEKDYGYLSVFIQTNKHKRYSKTMLEILEKVASEPLDEDFFIINKKNIIGNYITIFDNLSRVHDLLCNTVGENIRIDDYLHHILELKMEDLNALKAAFVPENIYSITYLKARKNS